MRLDGDDTPVKKVPGAGANSGEGRKDAARRDNDRRDAGRDNRNRSGKPSGNFGKQGGKHEEFAPGTIGYILAHQKKR